MNIFLKNWGFLSYLKVFLALSLCRFCSVLSWRAKPAYQCLGAEMRGECVCLCVSVQKSDFSLIPLFSLRPPLHLDT